MSSKHHRDDESQLNSGFHREDSHGSTSTVDVVVKVDPDADDSSSKDTFRGSVSSYEAVLKPSSQSESDLVKEKLLFRLDETPPWYITLMLGVQHNFQMISSAVAIPFILTPALCMENDDPDKAVIISTLIFMSGIITILQSTFGSTLPIVQGATVSHLVPALAIMNLPKWQCPANLAEMSKDEKREEWQIRMREIQGAVIFASLFEVTFALTGCIGFFTKFISPLTVGPAITMIGLSLFRNAMKEASKNFYVSGGMVLLLIIFSQHMRNFKISLPCSKHKTKFPLFQVFPVLFSIITAWTVCAILTYTNIIPEGDPARVDSKKRIIEESSWINLPYPFQFGWPSISLGSVLGMLCGVLTSTIESIGDYFCCANILNVPPPPQHAMNRGIFIEGFGCILSGIMGTGNASTSYSDNIGMLGITRVGSRRVVQFAGCVMILFGLFGKAGAAVVSLPDPILGGLFLFLFTLVMSVGISTLKDVNLESSRNIFIISFSIFIGLAISQWMDSGSVAINTGSSELNTLIQVLLSTGMFVAGFTACVLDNTIPGSYSDGKTSISDSQTTSCDDHRDKTYDLPFVMGFIEKYDIFKWIPISPTYKKHPISLLACKESKLRRRRSSRKDHTQI